jgi:hypothetical protein
LYKEEEIRRGRTQFQVTTEAVLAAAIESSKKPANLPVMFRRVVKISFFDHYFASFSY